jgi:hypothetical protein
MNHPFFPAQLAAGTRRPLRPASQLLPLEQRFMFDGAVADAAHAAQAHETAPPPVPPAVTVRAADPARDQGKKEVVLVDTSVANYKSLEAGVRDGVGIVEFDGSRDGLAQIAQWAAGQSGLDAIHILSHGAQGVLNLGSNTLTEASLASSTTQAELAQLGRALTTDGDLLLYGCWPASPRPPAPMSPPRPTPPAPPAWAETGRWRRATARSMRANWRWRNMTAR